MRTPIHGRACAVTTVIQQPSAYHDRPSHGRNRASAEQAAIVRRWCFDRGLTKTLTRTHRRNMFPTSKARFFVGQGDFKTVASDHSATSSTCCRRPVSVQPFRVVPHLGSRRPSTFDPTRRQVGGQGRVPCAPGQTAGYKGRRSDRAGLDRASPRHSHRTREQFLQWHQVVHPNRTCASTST